MTANNVTRMLDASHIRYSLLETEPIKLGAIELADKLGVPPEDVFKTIVVKRENPGKPILAVIPGPKEVNTKKLAAFLDQKKVHVTTMKEAETVTRLQTGGISPLALIHKGFQIVIDQSAADKPAILVSAGQRGMQVRLAPGDLARLCGARFGDITG
jgi:Cys-tRNA(Pro)/Cys-tRNA(Cys) deacylase